MRTAPKEGYKSISVVNLNHLGLSQENMPTKNLLNRIITLAAPYAPLDGMNEKGLSIGVLVINKGIVHQSTGKVPITTTSAIRMILDKAATNFILYNDMNEGSGQDRYEVIKAKQAETGGIMTEDEALELLLSVPSQGMRVIEGLNEEIESDTQWSCVYNLDDLTVQICTGRNKERIYNYKLGE